MEQKTIVISCALLELNQSQQAGMLKLFHDLENRGLRVYYYAPNIHPALEVYKLKQLHYPWLKYKYYTCKSLLQVSWKIWLPRVMANYNIAVPRKGRRFLKHLVRGAVKYLGTVDPAFFVCWNPNSAAFGLFSVVANAMGIKTGAIEGGLLPDTYILDRLGHLASSEIFSKPLTYIDPDMLLKEGEQIFGQVSARSISTYVQPEKQLPDMLLVDEQASTRVLLLGIDMVDSGTWPMHNPCREGLLPFHISSFAQALALAGADPSFKVIFKPHPAHNFHKQDEQVQPNLWIVNANADQLIEWADVVVCTGSKMEFSALLKNKPLVTVGAGLVYNKGCSYEVRKAGDLHAKVLEAKNGGFTLEQLRCFMIFLGFLKCHYLYVYSADHDNTEILNHFLMPNG